MDTTMLNGNLFVSMMRGGSVNIRENRSVVNELNVFPIPDGDTGDNMYMTVEAGCSAAIEHADDDLECVSAHAAHGMLLGARGNSGVILSRIFAGIAEGFKGCKYADVASVGAAFERGVKQAYEAVTVPVEGTILTVYRDAVGYANSRVSSKSTLQNYFDDFTTELRCSLERTPELLAVLKDAGVVDSGGAGFVYIAEGMKNVLNGIEIIESHTDVGAEKAKAVDTSSFNENSKMEYGYCTEFLLQLQTAKTDVGNFDLEEFKKYLASAGDSIVVFMDKSVIKVHVHTMTPGAVLEHCQKYGEFLTVKIENMTIQHSTTTVANNFTLKVPDKRRKYAIVTVACGEGITKTFRELGADYVVEGGQSMNPSAQDFIAAFDEVNAEVVFVLPNNRNIFLTARQAAELYTKSEVHVIPSHTLGDGYAALSMFDTSSENIDEIIDAAKEAMEGVVTGEISLAIRDSSCNGVKVHSGEYIGFVGGTIYTSTDTRNKAALELAASLDAGARDVIILICGADVPDDEANELYAKLSAEYRKTEIIMQNGGQAVYDYVMILE